MRFACASASINNTLEPCFARPTPRLTAVVVFPTPPFWFVRAITLQFDIGASSFRIDLATLSRWLCNSTRERSSISISLTVAVAKWKCKHFRLARCNTQKSRLLLTVNKNKRLRNLP